MILFRNTAFNITNLPVIHICMFTAETWKYRLVYPTPYPTRMSKSCHKFIMAKSELLIFKLLHLQPSPSQPIAASIPLFLSPRIILVMVLALSWTYIWSLTTYHTPIATALVQPPAFLTYTTASTLTSCHLNLSSLISTEQPNAFYLSF